MKLKHTDPLGLEQRAAAATQPTAAIDATASSSKGHRDGAPGATPDAVLSDEFSEISQLQLMHERTLQRSGPARERASHALSHALSATAAADSDEIHASFVSS